MVVSKKIRRFFRRFQYIPPTKRHILLITVCFWMSAITLWSIRHENGFADFEKDPFYTVIHQKISKWHKSDEKLPSLKKSVYSASELFAWHSLPLHSVRAVVNNSVNYLGEMGDSVQVPENLQNQAKKRFNTHQLNVVASDLVSLNRRLPDFRNPRY